MYYFNRYEKRIRIPVVNLFSFIILNIIYNSQYRLAFKEITNTIIRINKVEDLIKSTININSLILNTLSLF